jgi:hypothetical protein
MPQRTKSPLPVIILTCKNGLWTAQTTACGKPVIGRGKAREHALADLLSEPRIPNDRRRRDYYTIIPPEELSSS